MKIVYNLMVIEYAGQIVRPVSFHPVPRAMAREVFLSRKKFERFQSYAIFLVSKKVKDLRKILSLPPSTGKDRLF